MKPPFILKAKSSLIKKNVPKRAPRPTKNEVLDENTKIVAHIVNLELVYPKLQLHQILKPITFFFYSYTS